MRLQNGSHMTLVERKRDWNVIIISVFACNSLTKAEPEVHVMRTNGARANLPWYTRVAHVG